MGKSHYKWPFSIAMLNYRRVGWTALGFKILAKIWLHVVDEFRQIDSEKLLWPKLDGLPWFEISGPSNVRKVLNQLTNCGEHWTSLLNTWFVYVGLCDAVNDADAKQSFKYCKQWRLYEISSVHVGYDVSWQQVVWLGTEQHNTLRAVKSFR